jgi:hypothetical protein
MEHREETYLLTSIGPFPIPYFIGIENRMRGYTVDPVSDTLKAVKNRFRCDGGSAVLYWHSSAGLDACLSLYPMAEAVLVNKFMRPFLNKLQNSSDLPGYAALIGFRDP